MYRRVNSYSTLTRSHTSSKGNRHLDGVHTQKTYSHTLTSSHTSRLYTFYRRRRRFFSFGKIKFNQPITSVLEQKQWRQCTSPPRQKKVLDVNEWGVLGLDMKMSNFLTNDLSGDISNTRADTPKNWEEVKSRKVWDCWGWVWSE
jgi:hypothetical protein